jgi:hypothetical protein
VPTPRGADRLLTLAAIVLAVLFLARAVVLLRSPYPVDYGEGTTWTYARLLATHGTYFLPIAEPPYIHGTYPPLFPLLQQLLGGSLAAGRAVALFGSILAASAFGLILAHLGVAPRRAAFWGVILLGTPVLHEWAALCRVDTLALGLSLAGVWIALRFADAPRLRGELLAAPVLALALFTKQVAVAGPAAVFLSLWLRRERRRAALFAAVYLNCVLIGLALVYLRSGAEAFRHLVTYAGFVGLARAPLATWGLRFLFTFPVLLPLGLSAARSWLRTPAGLYAILALATIVMAGKPGAAANYLLEPGAGVMLLGALAAERRRDELVNHPERRRDFTLLLVVQMVILCGPGRPIEVFDLARERAVEAKVVAVLAAAPAPVLAEDLGLALAAGKEPMLEPFQFGLLARAGRFDPAPLIAGIQAGKFGTVVAGWRLRGIPGIDAALRKRYRRSEEIGPYEVWKP